MAFVVADRVQETTTSTGTGTITLAGAVTGFQSFAAVGNGNNTFYTIADQSGSNWEVGIGTYTSSGTTLSRDTVLSSSNSGSLVNFSAGTKNVFVTQPSSRSAYAATVPSNGQLLIGNGSGFSLATLSAGSGISVSNSSGGITITNTGGGGSATILESLQTISTNYTVTSAYNGSSVGPVTINTGVAVTVGTDQRWLIFG
jgi:hypothetical protein